MANVQPVKFLKIGLKDQPGALLGIMQGLKTKNISLKSLWGFGKQDQNADLFVIAKDKDIEKIKDVWTSSGISVEEGTAFFIKGVDKAGALLKPLEAIANANINIKAIVAIAVSGKFGSLIYLDPADIEKAGKVLGAK